MFGLPKIETKIIQVLYKCLTSTMFRRRSNRRIDLQKLNNARTVDLIVLKSLQGKQKDKIK